MRDATCYHPASTGSATRRLRGAAWWALLGLGLLAFLCLVAEGAMADWSAVYLRGSLGAGTAAAGFAAFSLAMASGRCAGDTLRSRMRAVPLIRFSGALAGTGFGIELLIGHPLAALLGFGCVGFGLPYIVPVLFSGPARTPGVAAGTGIAAVATGWPAGDRFRCPEYQPLNRSWTRLYSAVR